MVSEEQKQQRHKKISLLKLVRDPLFYKPIRVGCILMMIQQFSGIRKDFEIFQTNKIINLKSEFRHETFVRNQMTIEKSLQRRSILFHHHVWVSWDGKSKTWNSYCWNFENCIYIYYNIYHESFPKKTVNATISRNWNSFPCQSTPFFRMKLIDPGPGFKVDLGSGFNVPWI